MALLYHVTLRENAQDIIDNGFQDARECEHDLVDGAVQFASRPIYDDPMVFPDMDPANYVYFIIDFPDTRLDEYLLYSEDVDYLEYEIPIDEVNEYFINRTANDIPTDNQC